MPPDHAALVGSRICHDLISPIGAIGNGIELLALTEGNTTAEMDLISQSVENASARIRYFRIAFGATSPDQHVGRSEILSILSATARGGRFAYLWKVEGDQPRLQVRCALLLLMCLETALPLGGDVTVTRDGATWTIIAEGPRISINAPLWDSLRNPENDHVHTAAQVQFALLPGAIAAAGRELSLDLGEARITVKF